MLRTDFDASVTAFCVASSQLFPASPVVQEMCERCNSFLELYNAFRLNPTDLCHVKIFSQMCRQCGNLNPDL